MDWVITASRTFSVLIVLATLGALIMFAKSDYDLLSAPLDSAIDVAGEDGTAVDVANAPVDENIEALRYGLFGVYQEETEAESLPETRLDLSLKGAFANEDPNRASALIEVNGAPSKSYRVGDLVGEQAELIKVEREYVVLRRNGQDEVLRLPRLSGSILDRQPPISIETTVETSAPGGMAPASPPPQEEALPSLSERRDALRARLDQ